MSGHLQLWQRETYDGWIRKRAFFRVHHAPGSKCARLSRNAPFTAPIPSASGDDHLHNTCSRPRRTTLLGPRRTCQHSLSE